MRPRTLCCIVLLIATAWEASAQKKEFEYSLFFGERNSYGALPERLIPFSKGHYGYQFAGSVHFSAKPIGQPFRLKIGNQLVFRHFPYDKENVAVLLNRIPFDVGLSFGKRLTVCIEAGFYGSALLYLDAPETSDLYKTKRRFYFGYHYKLGMARDINKKVKIGISFHNYMDLTPFYTWPSYSPGGAVSQRPAYAYDNFLSIDYTIRLE